MKSRITWLNGTLLAVLLTAAAVAGSGCSQSDANADQTPATNGVMTTITVRVEEVRPSRFTDAISATGILKSREDVMLSPEEGGVVKEWLVEKGQPVRKGQVLGVLNDDVLKASYEAAAAQYKLSELNYTKQRSVYAEKAISELQFRNAQYTRDAAKAQANLMYARLERTRLRSPIDGVLNDRMKNEGEFAPPAMPVAHIVNLRSMRIVAELSERYAGAVSVGSVVWVLSEAFPQDTLTGTVEFVGAAVSPANRTFPVEIDIPNPDQRLKPEMIARVRIVRSVRSDALLINQDVAQLVDRERMVVYVENNGRAEERRVTVGGRRGNLVEVLDGLNAGDRLIVAGYKKLVDGQPVVVE